MDYIINPSWFYWISVLDGVKATLIASTIMSALVATILAGFVFGDSWGDEDEERNAKKALKISIVVLAFSIVGVIFIPSKQVLMEMMIAKYATHENAHVAVETVRSAVDYIIEAIKDLK